MPGSWVMLGKPSRISHLCSGTWGDPRSGLGKSYNLHRTFVVAATELITPRDARQFTNVERFDTFPVIRHIKRAIGQRLYVGEKIPSE